MDNYSHHLVVLYSLFPLVINKRNCTVRLLFLAFGQTKCEVMKSDCFSLSVWCCSEQGKEESSGFIVVGVIAAGKGFKTCGVTDCHKPIETHTDSALVAV